VEPLALRALDRGIRIACPDPGTRSLLLGAYGALRGAAGPPDLDYRVGRTAAGFLLERPGRAPVAAPDAGRLLALLDEDLTVGLQALRPDLYVLHAAALTRGERAVALVAPSGGGKSTLAWALLHHGFGYASDELAPVDLQALAVHPYPRALLLKAAPPPAYPCRTTGPATSRGLHVTAEEVPAEVCDKPLPLAAVLFLRHAPGATPAARPVTPAEAAARLYANALNPLAHPGDGLEGAIRIAAAQPGFELVTADLPATCAVVARTLDRLLP
jgi:hypothetical protein